MHKQKKYRLLFWFIYNTYNSPYISITRTVDSSNKLVSQVYTYNIKTDKLILEGEVPYTSQYPVTCFDRKNNLIYYSSKSLDSKGDQLWVKNIKNSKSKQLTKDFFAINDIQLIKDNIYIDSSFMKSSNSHHHVLTKYNPKDNTLTKWWDPNKDDSTILKFKYSKRQDSLYISSYSWEERIKNGEESNKTQSDKVKPPIFTTSYFRLNGSKEDIVYKTDKELAFLL